jgi:hypothetical protein
MRWPITAERLPATSSGKRIQRKLAYVQEEVRVLKEVMLTMTSSARISAAS